MKLFVRYLRQNLRLYAALAAFCLIFAVSFALYHLPLKAVAYPTLLCVLLAIVLSLLDFRRKKRRHEELMAVRGITEAAQAALPCAESIEDEDYHNKAHRSGARTFLHRGKAQIHRHERLLHHLGASDKDPDSLDEAAPAK